MTWYNARRKSIAPLTDEEKATMRVLLDEGYIDREVAHVIGCSSKTVARFRSAESILANGAMAA